MAVESTKTEQLPWAMKAKQNVRDHVRFPRRNSNARWEYLDEGLSISHMYMLYKEKHEVDVDDPVVKE